MDSQSNADHNFMDIFKEQSDYFTKFKKSSEYEAFVKTPVAYFCAEYALDPTLPTYAGGLGILAGDYMFQPDEKLPVWWPEKFGARLTA